jgi:hypothetical protein
MVRRRVEVLRRAAVAIGRVFDVTRIDTNEGSSLVRPILNSRTSNAASWRTTVSNIAFMSWESMRWPSASTTSVAGGATAFSFASSNNPRFRT